MAILDTVLNELKNSNANDPIHKWLDNINIKRLIKRSDSNILIKYGQVLEYLKQISAIKKKHIENGRKIK